jgi:hypothetical protein
MIIKRMIIRLALIIALIVIIVPATFAQNYVLIGWNDLGMHCSNKYFSKIAVLPPYNNITAQLLLIQPDQMPQIVTSGYTIEYSIPNNTYSVGKTDFWTYAQQLFNLPNPLPDNVGLTGKGLTGVLDNSGSYFAAHGIPVTPFADSDLVNEVPFQIIHLVAKNTSNGEVLATTDVVIPVSNEVGCVQSGCHSSETAILNSHEDVSGFNRSGPVLCASCHASNALGTTGIPEAGPFSMRIHEKHSGLTGPSNDISVCYKCHPGPKTQCLRDIMGKNTINPLVCQNCHGTMAEVAASVETGRRPWLDEPKCGNCHGTNFAENPGKLYRQSTGHGGLFCSACHGSPHAILPTIQPNDNLQNIRLQGSAGTLKKCSVCHLTPPIGPGPHTIYDTTGVAPLSPLQVSPHDGSIGITTNPSLQWNIVQNALTYGLQVSLDSTFATTVINDSLLSLPSIQLPALLENQIYYWHVNAKNPVGTSPWSETWKFETASGSTFAYQFNDEWNIVSLPLLASNSDVHNIFPTAATAAFEFNSAGGYLEQPTLSNGKGYWLKFNNSQSLSMTGTVINTDTIDVIDGWNLIGSISNNVLTGSVTSIPTGIISSGFFGYKTSYQLVDTISPAKGYWVKTAAGKIILSNSILEKSGSISPINYKQQWDKIIVQDVKGRQQELYIANKLENGISLSYFEMPPSPPEDAMDVRFASNRILELYNTGRISTYPVKISSASYPLEIIWDIKESDNSVSLDIGGELNSLNSTGSMKIENEKSLINLTITPTGRELPQDFILEQNYPNPFNPSTTFRYGLPTQCKVRLEIYDVLGQKIQEVYHGIQDAGYHEVEWAGNVASGLYLYQLEATSITDASMSSTQIRKMVLLK